MPLSTELTHPESPADGLAAVVALRRLADRMEDAEVGETAERHHGGEAVGGALGVGELGGERHGRATLVDKVRMCQPRLRDQRLRSSSVYV